MRANRTAATSSHGNHTGTAASEKAGPLSEGAVLSVELVGFEHDRGTARVALWDSAEGFPGEAGKEADHRVVDISGGRAQVDFDDVVPGLVAVSAHHDEDGDGEMDTAIFGMPAEGYGFSRDAKVAFGPPSFEAAQLQVAANQPQHIVIHMRY